LQALLYSPGSHEISEGVLFANKDWFYPVINGIPYLTVEAFLDHSSFFEKHLPDYLNRKIFLLEKYGRFVKYVTKKNRRTKKSFTQEWRLFDYKRDKTWNKDGSELMKQFLEETGESSESLKIKSSLTQVVETAC
jgi:hypothetical protein